MRPRGNLRSEEKEEGSLSFMLRKALIGIGLTILDYNKILTNLRS